MRARALAAVAAILLGLLSGLSAPSPGTSAPAPRSAAVTSAEGSISPATGTPALSLRAVEPATPTSLVRSEGRQTVRALATFLLLLVLLVGTHIVAKRPRPASGGRAGRTGPDRVVAPGARATRSPTPQHPLTRPSPRCRPSGRTEPM